MSDKYIVILNPNAGNGRGNKDWHLIESQLKQFNINYECLRTQGSGHAGLICAEQIRSGNKNFIVVGGDGTLNEVLNGIYSLNDINFSEIVLSNIPVGTGNDWCRTYNIPNDYRENAEIISKRNIFYQDIGKATYMVDGKSESKYFMNVAGMGFDAFVAFQTNKKKEEGKGSALIYLYTLMISLFKYKSTRVTIRTGNTILDDLIFSIGIGIGKYNGGGMMQLPNAIPNDGMFDVTIIKKMNKMEVISNIKKLYDGSIIYHPKVSVLSAKEIFIDSEPPVSLEVDGEKCGSTPIKLEIFQQVLPVIVP